MLGPPGKRKPGTLGGKFRALRNQNLSRESDKKHEDCGFAVKCTTRLHQHSPRNPENFTRGGMRVQPNARATSLQFPPREGLARPRRRGFLVGELPGAFPSQAHASRLHGRNKPAWRAKPPQARRLRPLKGASKGAKA